MHKDLENRSKNEKDFRYKIKDVRGSSLNLTVANFTDPQYYIRELQVYKDVGQQENLVCLLGITSEAFDASHTSNRALHTLRYPFLVLPYYERGSMSFHNLKELKRKYGIKPSDKIKMVSDFDLFGDDGLT